MVAQLFCNKGNMFSIGIAYKLIVFCRYGISVDITASAIKIGICCIRSYRRHKGIRIIRDTSNMRQAEDDVHHVFALKHIGHIVQTYRSIATTDTRRYHI